VVIRQARLTAWLLVATIALFAICSLAWFGPEHILQDRVAEGSGGLRVWEAALRYPGMALFWMIVYGAAARVRPWRRNIVRTASVFAMTWVSTMALVLGLQTLTLAGALGYNIDSQAGFAAIVGVVLLLRANLLPKSRPAWFNGVALPVFASRTDVWRKVHRASAVRIIIIAVVALFLAAFAPPEINPLRPIVLLLLAEVVFSSAHGLWLGNTTEAPPSAGAPIA
jgi:uncharacterized membrane protein